MKKITILGSTGSIGTQALDIIRENPDKFKATSLTCGSNVELFAKQIEEFKPEIAVCADEKEAINILKKFPKLEVYHGESGLIEVASKSDCDMVLNALMGMRGLVPTYHAIMAKKAIALANKETLVAGGNVIMEAANSVDIKLIPVDSEHSAIFQCLQGNNKKELNKIWLTASGGPFRGYSKAQLENVSLEQALKHPNWSMGKKITIDSATMMNKGLEVIEAKWLFDINCSGEENYEDKIEVVIHPESIVHSMVEYVDGSVIAQLGLPDMKTPIAYSFTYPNRLEMSGHGADFFKLGKLTFEKPDKDTFMCLGLAFDALKKGGSYPVVLNAANEILVQKFLDREINFISIQNNLDKIMNSHNPITSPSLEDIIGIDSETRLKTEKESR